MSLFKLHRKGECIELDVNKDMKIYHQELTYVVTFSGSFD